MAAAMMATPTYWYNMLHEAPLFFNFVKVTQSDWVYMKGFKGVVPVTGMNKAATSGANTMDVTFTYGTVTFAAGGAATATSLAATVATISRGQTSSPFYVQLPSQTAGVPGEIMEVTNDSAPTAATSTFTVKRGCLGTTAQIIAAGDVGAIMNILFFGGSGVGTTICAVIPLPNESRAPMFQG